MNVGDCDCGFGADASSDYSYGTYVADATGVEDDDASGSSAAD